MDSLYERVPGEYRWHPSVSHITYRSIPRINGLCYIIGTGPSLDNLTAQDLQDAALILCINHSLPVVEALGLDCPVYGIQINRIQVPGNSPRLINEGCKYLYPDNKCCLFDHKKLGTLYTSDTAVAIGKRLGATGFICYGMDAAFGCLDYSSSTGREVKKVGINDAYLEQPILMRKAAAPCNVEIRDLRGRPINLVTKDVCIRRVTSVGVINKFMTGLVGVFTKAGYNVSQSLSQASPNGLAVVWNGLRGSSKEWLKGHVGPTLYLEHGFIQRSEYVQIDKSGFLHKASWAHSFKDPLPTYARSRLTRLCDPKPIEARQSGDILILGQVDGDSQLYDSQIKTAETLLEVLSPAVTDAIFRPHPKSGRTARTRKNITIKVHDTSVRREYNRTKGSDTLDQALEKARFVIAINSNGLVDATIAGVPCLAFGPSLGLYAGCYRQATVSTIKADVEAMMRGWCPSQKVVDQYLGHLVCRQYTLEELGNPFVLEAILRGEIPSGY